MRTIVVLCGVAATALAAVVVVTQVRQRPLPGLNLLFVPSLALGAAALVAVGIWAVVRRRSDHLPWGAAPRRSRWGLPWPISGLPRGHRIVVTIVQLFGVLAFVSAAPSIPHGVPASPTGTCQYPLVDRRGSETCVSEAEYDRVAGAHQRIVAGWLLAVVALVGGMALAELRWPDQLRQRDPDDDWLGRDPGPDVASILGEPPPR